ncbi:unnamed protein product [Clonostachys byssicola]|uniref:Uncharacterized protein n=1 Tax=Clonostachys byssicola TaxID=160290 RepID=A0A9N9UR09_9HYPO|nr:unnamed protein product [Clonostachys byssicola]
MSIPKPEILAHHLCNPLYHHPLLRRNLPSLCLLAKFDNLLDIQQLVVPNLQRLPILVPPNRRPNHVQLEVIHQVHVHVIQLLPAEVNLQLARLLLLLRRRKRPHLQHAQPRRQQRLPRHLNAPQRVKVPQPHVHVRHGQPVQVGHLARAEDVGVHLEEGEPPLGPDVLPVALAALRGADDVDAQRDACRGVQGRGDDDETRLVRDVEDEGLGPVVRVDEDGLGVLVARGHRGVPGHAGIAADEVALEELRAQGHLGVLAVDVAQGVLALRGRQELEGPRRLLGVFSYWYLDVRLLGRRDLHVVGAGLSASPAARAYGCRGPIGLRLSCCRWPL